MPLPSFTKIMEVVDGVDKCCKILARADDLASELVPGQTVDMEIGPDDTDDDDTRGAA